MSILRPSAVARLSRTWEPAALRICPATIRALKTVVTPVNTSNQADRINSVVEFNGKQVAFRTEPDQASSSFSPSPTLSQVHSQNNMAPAALLSGGPSELQARNVRIYRPTKPATQSGNWHGHHWRMDWDVLPKGHRWENTLMGWQSSADFVQGTHLTFKTKEDAVSFAEKHGYEYFVQEPNSRKIKPKAYADNFLWSDKKLKHIRTK